jgi:hypothetical protein
MKEEQEDYTSMSSCWCSWPSASSASERNIASSVSVSSVYRCAWGNDVVGEVLVFVVATASIAS